MGIDSKKRIINTFQGKEIDRFATYDIIHNKNLIEYVSKEKITPKNAEDITCKTVGRLLDMVRHFSIPDISEPKIETDEDGFIRKIDWWTILMVERPFDNMKSLVDLVKKDIDSIYNCISNKKVCRQAQFPCRLFGEEYEYLEEVKDNFRRVTGKMDGTVMIAPESCTLYYALERYGIDWWSYLYRDYPELANKHLDALLDYELLRIDSFADISLTPVSFTSDPIGTNNSLMFSPDFTQEVIFPRTKKLIERWKSYGYYHIYFADGYKWPVLDEILSWDLIDAIDPFEPLAHMDVGRFRDKYPNTVICQPIDCQNLLYSGTPEEVETATLKAIKDAGEQKIIIGSTSEMHPQVPVKNALAMYETAKKYKS